jgi:putative ABC transport system substrate-binding protein
MRRRQFARWLGGAALAWPMRALAQRGAQPVIGLLSSGSPKELTRTTEAFRRGLREGGYVEGKDVAIEYRWAEGRYERLPALAAELVKRNVAVIAAISTPAALAAKGATSAIPIVFTGGGDPVKLGLVATLSHPGGNVTGISNVGNSLEGKRIQTLRDLVPTAKRIAYLTNPKFPRADSLIVDVKTAGTATASGIEVFKASNEVEIDSAFAAIARSHADAVLVSADSYFISRRRQIVELAARYAIPTCYAFGEFTAAGGLMSYGPDLLDANRQTGLYTARVLKGAKPADLPVVQSVRFELILNRTTAKKLGLSVSRDFLERVDQLVD